jgi:hypothetical protein
MKILHQIYISDNNYLPSEYVLDKIKHLKQLYSDYEYILWDNKKIELFLKENFDERVLISYQKLKPYAFKSDLARYCILYIHGGYYFDVSICPEKKIEFDYDFVITKGITDKLDTNNYKIVDNGFIFVKNKNDSLLKKIIDQSVFNIMSMSYGDHPLTITSSIMIHKVISDYEEKNKIHFLNLKKGEKSKQVYFNNELFYNYKPYQYSSNLELLGCKGVNSYEKMYYDCNVFNVNVNKKKFLVFSGAGDSEDQYLSWASKKSDVFDRCIFYYGNNFEKYKKILEYNFEYTFKKKGMIWSNFADHYKCFNFEEYEYVLVVDSDLEINQKDLEDTFEMAQSNNWSGCQWSRDEKSFGDYVCIYKQDENKIIRKTNYIEMLFMMIRKDLVKDLVEEWFELKLDYATGIDLILSNLALRTKKLPFYIIDKYKFYNPWPHDKINGREVDVITNSTGENRISKLDSIIRNDRRKYRIWNNPYQNNIQCEGKKINNYE